MNTRVGLSAKLQPRPVSLRVNDFVEPHRGEPGRHYPTDIYAGRAFALAIVREMKTSPAFAKDWAEVQKEIAAAQTAANPAPAAAAH